MNDYEDIITTKYSRDELKIIFSETNTIKTWRKCWVALAESEKELGVKAITKEMISEMKNNIENIDFIAAKNKEKEIQHDVMSHVYAYGLVCPTAKGIIHLGATSQCIKCNTDLILQYEALKVIRTDIINILKAFYDTILKTNESGGRVLGDGGLVNNLPIDVARAMGVDALIVVNVGTPLAGREALGSALGVTTQMINILTEQKRAAQPGDLGTARPVDHARPGKAGRR